MSFSQGLFQISAHATPGQMDRKRKAIRDLIRRSGGARYAGEGLAHLASGIAAGQMGRRLDQVETEQEGRAQATVRDAANGALSRAEMLEAMGNPFIPNNQKRVIEGMLKGDPRYRYGTPFHLGGPAIVGENGPERVDLPRGAKVTPLNVADNVFGKMDPEVSEYLSELSNEDRAAVMAEIEAGADPMEALDGFFKYQDEGQYDGPQPTMPRSIGPFHEYQENPNPSFFGPDGTLTPDIQGSTQDAPKPWQRRLNSLQYRIPEARYHLDEYGEGEGDLNEMEHERDLILNRYKPEGFIRASLDGGGGSGVMIGGEGSDALPPSTMLDKIHLELDKKYIPEFLEWSVQGKSADARKSIEQLREAVGVLEGGQDNITGPFVGKLPDWLSTTLNPEAVDTREKVEEIVQRNLRLVLGAQFTEKEGERLIARAYNPQLDEGTNAKRVRRLLMAIETAADARDRAAAYFQKNGTLVGYEGQLLGAADILSAMEDDRASGEGVPDGVDPDDWKYMTEEEKALFR